MTVQELIEKLQQFPPNASCEDAMMKPIDYVALDESSDDEHPVVVVCA